MNLLKIEKYMFMNCLKFILSSKFPYHKVTKLLDTSMYLKCNIINTRCQNKKEMNVIL